MLLKVNHGRLHNQGLFAECVSAWLVPRKRKQIRLVDHYAASNCSCVTKALAGVAAASVCGEADTIGDSAGNFSRGLILTT
jgi:hypothetical protein